MKRFVVQRVPIGSGEIDGNNKVELTPASNVIQEGESFFDLKVEKLNHSLNSTVFRDLISPGLAMSRLMPDARC